MKKLELYLETSIFGFYTDLKRENITKRESIRELFEQIKKDYFIAYTSPLTIAELTKIPDKEKNILLNLVKQCKIEVVDTEYEELVNLVNKYKNERIIPEKFEADLYHVGYATILKVDILVSFNMKHIVKEINARKFNGVNLREGYPIIQFRTPEEVLYEE